MSRTATEPSFPVAPATATRIVTRPTYPRAAAPMLRRSRPANYAGRMVSFADVAVTDATAHRMLSDYFAERAATFPPRRARTARPSPTRASSSPPAGVFLLAYDDERRGRLRRNPRAARAPGGRRTRQPPVVRYEIKHLWVAPSHRGRGHRPRDPRRAGASRPGLRGDRGRARHEREPRGGRQRSTARHGYEDIQPYNDNPNATDWFRKQLA